MTSKHHIFRLGLAAVVLHGASAAQALSLADLQGSAVIGQRLQVQVPVRLAPGEQLAQDCVFATVQAGDNELSRGQVGVRLADERSDMARIIVTTSTEIREPIVEVEVMLSCGTVFSRRYVLFADPPLAPPVIAAPAAPPPAVAQRQVASTQQSGSTPAPRASTAPAVSAPVPAPAPSRAAPPPPAPRVAAPAAAPAPRPAARPAPAPAPARTTAGPASTPPAASASPTRSAAATRPPAASAPAARAPAQAAASPSGPRLQLDPVDLTAMPAVLRQDMRLSRLPQEGATQEREAARALWAQLNATPESRMSDMARLEELERQLLAVQAQADQSRRAVDVLERHLRAATQRDDQSALLYGLAGLALVLLVIILWMSRELRRQREQWWAESVLAAEAARTGLGGPVGAANHRAGFTVISEPGELTGSSSSSGALAEDTTDNVPLPSGPGWALPGMGTGARALVSSDRSVGGHMPPLGGQANGDRHVTAEELLDLEQQAEFFVALGQVDEAVDLLESHVSSESAASPMPFLKLLELYRTQDRQADYTRIRVLFNERFNTYAPAWEEPPGQGRSLEDYDDAMDRLCRLWQSPQILELIENSLFRREDADTFDLPAYRELMMLYAIARYKMDANGSDVDLFLPSGSSVSGSLDAAPLLATTRMPAYPPADASLDRTAPVDVDLAEFESHAWIDPNTEGGAMTDLNFNFDLPTEDLQNQDEDTQVEARLVPPRQTTSGMDRLDQTDEYDAGSETVRSRGPQARG